MRARGVPIMIALRGFANRDVGVFGLARSGLSSIVAI